MKIAIINGPNLNWLGKREPSVYGNKGLKDLEEEWKAYGKDLGMEVITFQGNGEGELLDYIYSIAEEVDGIVINPGAYTHYSYALRDCLAGIDVKVVEVHISNLEKREAFRHVSLISPVVWGKISGLGTRGYTLALEAFK